MHIKVYFYTGLFFSLLIQIEELNTVIYLALFLNLLGSPLNAWPNTDHTFFFQGSQSGYS